jgi:Homeodomain-like domain
MRALRGRGFDLMGAKPLTSFPEIIEVIGESAAKRLSYRFPGLRIYILKHYPDAHPVVAAIGREAADQLMTYFHGRQLFIPGTIGLKAEVLRLADQGDLTRHEIAAQLHISERRVYRWLGERASSAQMTLSLE